MVQVKICGLTRESDVDSAIRLGADLVGLVHHPRSPRHLDIARIGELARRTQGAVSVVVLLVDPDDATIEAVLREARPDYLQLHGKETQGRVSAIRGGFDIPVIKALGVSTPTDLGAMDDYSNLCDLLLIDAKPAPEDTRPGGLGRTFDWTILQARTNNASFLLAGGLTPDNVRSAIATARPWGVDVSTGVETAPGIKDAAKIEAFIAAALGAE
jgi:phosphoribosylanthranilate isomerase